MESYTKNTVYVKLKGVLSGERVMEYMNNLNVYIRTTLSTDLIITAKPWQLQPLVWFGMCGVRVRRVLLWAAER